MSPPAQTLSEEERRDWLRLIRAENVGPITFRELLRRFGNASAAIDAIPDLARRGGRRKPIRIPGAAEVEDELAAADAAGARYVALVEADYPALLATLSDAPPLICLRGHAVLFKRPAVAIVGARNASASAQRFTRRLAADLGALDFIVASGMARGIDTAAHEGALATGTIAALAGGVDVVYPPENQKLYEQISESGVALSEMPIATIPKATHFPRRNRLISGLAYGVVVVEAAIRSGSLITARLAGDQGREVFAVPGSPMDPRCKGINGLIRQGAVLTESVDDIVQVIAPMLEKPVSEPDIPDYRSPAPVDEPKLDDARDKVLSLLGATAVEVDELIRLADLTPAIVLTILLELELAGKLERHAGQRVSLR